MSIRSEFDFNGFVRGADSPPPLSETVSPDKTTEKKISQLALKSKLGAKKQRLDLKCMECGADHNEKFLAYVEDSNFGNCEVCGCFRNITGALMAANQGYDTKDHNQQASVAI